MEIVAVIHHWIYFLLAGSLEVLAISFSRVGVASRGRIVVACADVYVGRHVNKMAGSRSKHLEPLRACQGPLRMRRSFHGMDVVVVRTDVLRVASKYGFQNRDHFLGAFGRLTVLTPELPWSQIHNALGVEGGGIEIISEAPVRVGHCILVVNGKLLQIGLGIV